MTTLGQLQNAQGAKNALASAGTEQKNDALLAMADALEKAQERILDANREDLTAARSLSGALLVRLCWIVWHCLLRVSRTWHGESERWQPFRIRWERSFRKRSGRMAWLYVGLRFLWEW